VGVQVHCGRPRTRQHPNQVLTSVDKTHGGVLRQACRLQYAYTSHQTRSRYGALVGGIELVKQERVQQLAKRTRIMEKSAGTARLNIWLSYLLCQSESPVPLAHVTPLCRRRTLRCLTNNGAAGTCGCSTCRSKPLRALCAGWPESKDLRTAPLHKHLQTVGAQPPSRGLGACPHSTRPIPSSWRVGRHGGQWRAAQIAGPLNLLFKSSYNSSPCSGKSHMCSR